MFYNLDAVSKPRESGIGSRTSFDISLNWGWFLSFINLNNTLSEVVIWHPISRSLWENKNNITTMKKDIYNIFFKPIFTCNANILSCWVLEIQPSAKICTAISWLRKSIAVCSTQTWACIKTKNMWRKIFIKKISSIHFIPPSQIRQQNLVCQKIVF